MPVPGSPLPPPEGRRRLGLATIFVEEPSRRAGGNVSIGNSANGSPCSSGGRMTPCDQLLVPLQGRERGSIPLGAMGGRKSRARAASSIGRASDS